MELVRGFDILTQKDATIGPKTCFAHKKRGKWIEYTWEDYKFHVENICLGLHDSGIIKGDCIASITNDRPEWNFVDFGIQMAGAIHVPIPLTASDAEIEHIFKETQPKIIFVSSKYVLTKVSKIIMETGSKANVFTFAEIKGANHFSDVIDLGKQNTDNTLLKKITESIKPEDTAVILYTSGTSNKPKGVMLSHANLASMPAIFSKVLPIQPDYKALSIIPLSHIAGRKNNYVYQFLGLPVYYGEPGQDITEIFRETKPNVTALVPLYLEKIYTQINLSRPSGSWLKARLFDSAFSLTQNFDPNTTMSLWDRLLFSLADKYFYRKWRNQIGGGLKIIICGGAAISLHLLKFFWAIKVPVFEIYGMTESCALISVNTPHHVKFGTTGKAYKDMEVILAEDKEILCKGPNIMQGYFNDKELTAETIDTNGFFHTGDIGIIDEEGYIKITGRKKEVFKTASGEYVIPGIIENKLKKSVYIKHAVISGENDTQLIGIIAPDYDQLEPWANTNNIQFSSRHELNKSKPVIDLFNKEVEKYNDAIIATENINKIVLVSDTWTAEGGELSSFMKVKRKFILDKYQEMLK
ncbi:MAG: AMP-binding protein [Bacteroidales bacterium]|nr:AMP-binding protein [Bacteroidales bacterium]MCF8404536.1 AMP-binding protein [Bacteroidales bacterium]